MNLDHVFKKTLVRPFAGIRKKPEVPEGLLCKCSMCKKAIVAEDVRKNFYVCPSCNGYFRVRAQERIARIADEGSFLEWDHDLVGKNPMEFEGYEEKIAAARLKTRLKEAVVTGQCTIGGEPCVLCVMDGRFMMASMGEALPSESVLLSNLFAGSDTVLLHMRVNQRKARHDSAAQILGTLYRTASTNLDVWYNLSS